ncbi:F0F1 ATP synthase subunit gamma [Nesterenkonia sp. E16_7]|uniref:F0F1 ATP synthase subunit gamma n=1 Tax=unclassified Nesterenkonia TaxID=2629769 RepID=UPI001A93534D|nr:MULTISPECIES: F0F1 ATP synthase subunit gamma [unclassified Nesterenkonia]MBO0596188.1 F0F1 ATP synthase subunit gamma [Nesterenkonia sp. E16_10]MBO0598960.1 F0F1 ATP synthase subunit gamma [Nesterenkonia sp. E16_7]
MGAQIRVYRQKIASTSSMKKIFKAMELIATSRIGKARSRARAASPYADAITRAVSAVASQNDIDHVLTTKVENPTRAAVLILTSDRGLAGAYSTNVLKRGEALTKRLREDGKEVRPYLYGRKAQAFYDFREREYDQVWTGNTDAPEVDRAQEIGRTLVDRFLQPTEEGGVDELYLVYTEFQSMVKQEPVVRRLLPLAFVEQDADAKHEPTPLYDFEPAAEEVLDALLPRYIESKIFAAMLEASASELAARQRAMKSAADNADDLIKKYTLLRNNARQAEITQELSELIAGADALAAS